MEVVEVDIDAAKDVGMNTIEGAGADSEENVTADGQACEPAEDSPEKIESIESEAPSPLDVPHGCPFQNRCEHCMEKCRRYRRR